MIEFHSGDGGAVGECFAEHAGFAMRCAILVVCYIFQVYISPHISIHYIWNGSLGSVQWSWYKYFLIACLSPVSVPHRHAQCDSGQKAGTWLQLSSHQASTASLSKGYTERHARCPGDDEVGGRDASVDLVVAVVVLCMCGNKENRVVLWCWWYVYSSWLGLSGV